MPMKKTEEKKTIYYKDEINDDFAGNNINKKPLGDKYKYPSKRSFIWKTLAYILYFVIACPIVSLLNIIFYGEKIIGRNKIKGYRKNGFFVYANHTLSMGDAYTPSRICFPKKAHIIINSDGVSIPIIGRIVEMLGGTAVPDDYKSFQKFTKEIDYLQKKGKAVYIYPEAHIWPYYTEIRPFLDVSFNYPAKTNKPIFTATRVYEKRKIGKGVKVKVYVDGPFFADQNLPVKERQRFLRNTAYEKMVERAKLSTYKAINYVKEI